MGNTVLAASPLDITVRGWTPIEAAPKDGTKILVSDGKRVDAAYWDYEDWCAPYSSANNLPYEPAYFMPLPEAPN